MVSVKLLSANNRNRVFNVDDHKVSVDMIDKTNFSVAVDKRASVPVSVKNNNQITINNAVSAKINDIVQTEDKQILVDAEHEDGHVEKKHGRIYKIIIIGLLAALLGVGAAAFLKKDAPKPVEPEPVGPESKCICPVVQPICPTKEIANRYIVQNTFIDINGPVSQLYKTLTFDEVDSVIQYRDFMEFLNDVKTRLNEQFITAKQAGNNKTASDIKHQIDNIDKIYEIKDNLQSEVNDAKILINKYKQENDEYRKNLDHQKDAETRAHYEEIIKRNEELIDQYEADKENYDSMTQSLMAIMGKFNGDVSPSNIVDTVAKLLNSANTSQSQLDNIQREYEIQNKKIKDLESQLNSIERSDSELKRHNENMIKMITKFISRLNSITGKEDMKKLFDELKKIQQEYDKMKDKNDDMIHEMMKTANTLYRTKVDNNDKNTAYDKLIQQAKKNKEIIDSAEEWMKQTIEDVLSGKDATVQPEKKSILSAIGNMMIKLFGGGGENKNDPDYAKKINMIKLADALRKTTEQMRSKFINEYLSKQMPDVMSNNGTVRVQPTQLTNPTILEWIENRAIEVANTIKGIDTNKIMDTLIVTTKHMTFVTDGMEKIVRVFVATTGKVMNDLDNIELPHFRSFEMPVVTSEPTPTQVNVVTQTATTYDNKGTITSQTTTVATSLTNLETNETSTYMKETPTPVATAENHDSIISSSIPTPTATATATATATSTAVPTTATSTATSTAVPTATSTSTAVPTATSISIPIPTPTSASTYSQQSGINTENKTDATGSEQTDVVKPYGPDNNPNIVPPEINKVDALGRIDRLRYLRFHNDEIPDSKLNLTEEEKDYVTEDQSLFRFVRKYHNLFPFSDKALKIMQTINEDTYNHLKEWFIKTPFKSLNNKSASELPANMRQGMMFMTEFDKTNDSNKQGDIVMQYYPGVNLKQLENTKDFQQILKYISILSTQPQSPQNNPIQNPPNNQHQNTPFDHQNLPLVKPIHDKKIR